MSADLLGVLVSLDRVDPHLPGRQAQCPEEQPARLRPVHLQPCPLSPWERPHLPRLGLAAGADLVDGTRPPSLLPGDRRPDPGSRPPAW